MAIIILNGGPVRKSKNCRLTLKSKGHNWFGFVVWKLFFLPALKVYFSSRRGPKLDKFRCGNKTHVLTV